MTESRIFKNVDQLSASEFAQGLLKMNICRLSGSEFSKDWGLEIHMLKKASQVILLYNEAWKALLQSNK